MEAEPVFETSASLKNYTMNEKCMEKCEVLSVILKQMVRIFTVTFQEV
jgi:hypothetical protein